MDPRPATTDPLSAVDADIDAVDSAPAEEQLEIYSRIHSGLAAALAGTQSDPSAGGRPGN